METVVIKLQVEGIHFWKDCNIQEVMFLKEPHRHIFHIQCEKKVDHLDRDIEFIQLKRDVEDYLFANYHEPIIRCHNFAQMSCEMIARILKEKFNLCFVEVLEDNENGARIYAYDFPA